MRISPLNLAVVRTGVSGVSSSWLALTFLAACLV